MQSDYLDLYQIIAPSPRRRSTRPCAAQTFGIGLIPWSPLAGGFLTGKYKREGTQSEGRFSDHTHPRAAGLLDSGRAFETVHKLEGFAVERGTSLSQLALAWTVQQPGITSCIIGPRALA